MSFIEIIRKFLNKIIEWGLSYKKIVYYTHNGDGKKPFNKHKGDAGYDLFVSKDILLAPNSVTLVPTGIHIQPKNKIWFEIKGRSSTPKRYNITVIGAVIDKGYRGEMFIQVFNHSGTNVRIDKGYRICQLIPHYLIPISFIFKNKLDGSLRGIEGFGSTGK